MFSSTCPFCHQSFPSSQLEWHANNHFLEEECARDMELARQLALAPSSPLRNMDCAMDMELARQIALAPSSPLRNLDTQIYDVDLYEILLESKRNTSSFSASKNDRRGEYILEEISCLINLQIRNPFHKVENGLMTLLRRCLELETGNTFTILSSYVDHFQSVEEDAGWGCGWRNIQMLSSHLLMQNPEAKEVLFGGSGFVPDIPSLQRWLEIAWKRDFDTFGSQHFKNEVYGSTKRIGTTECATLFRSFGLKARLVDFGGKEIESHYQSVYGAKVVDKIKRNRGKRKQGHVYGPIDKFFPDSKSAASQADPLVDVKPKHNGIESGGGPSASAHSGRNQSVDWGEVNKDLVRETRGHQLVCEWIWDYFSDNKFKAMGNLQHVIMSEKMPLYFQHDGHSTTIVGIQAKLQNGMPKQHNLLILDPGQRTKSLERSLRENVGWQKLIKRGVHTLKKQLYQLCFIDPGIAHGEEMDQLKTLDSKVIQI